MTVPAPKAIEPTLLAVAPVPKAVAELTFASERVPNAVLNEASACAITPTATEPAPDFVAKYCLPPSTSTKYDPVKSLNCLAAAVELNVSFLVPAVAVPALPCATKSKSSPPMATDEFPAAWVFAPTATDWFPGAQAYCPTATDCLAFVPLPITLLGSQFV